MSKFISFMKNTMYIRMVNPRQLVGVITILASLLPSVISASVPVALADEGTFDVANAFLAVQPITLEEKDEAAMILQDNLFVAVAKITANNSSVKTVINSSGAAVIVTAYSSTVDQTDSTPFITANGTHVKDGIIACNFLPFGTKVKFPEYSGDKVYTVEDRMAKKNSHKIDIWMPSRALAMEFGVQKLAYEVIE